MPLIVIRKSARSRLLDVLLAPFVVVLAAIITKWWIFVVLIVSLVVSAILGADLRGFVTRKEVVVCLGVVVFLWLASIPLAIKDRLVYGSWEPVGDAKAQDCCMRMASALSAGDSRLALGLLDDGQRLKSTADDLQRFQDSIRTQMEGRPSIIGFEELQLTELQATARMRPFLDRFSQSQFSMVGVVFVGPQPREKRPSCGVYLFNLLRDDGDFRIGTMDFVRLSSAAEPRDSIVQ